MPAKAPEKLLDRQDIEYLTGLAKKAVLNLFKTTWKVPGGTKLIAGEYRVPQGFYNRWVDAQDVALKSRAKQEEHAHA